LPYAVEHLCYYLIHTHRHVYTKTSNHFEFMTTHTYNTIINSKTTAPFFILHFSLVEPLSSNFSFLLHTLFSLLSFTHSSLTIVFPIICPYFSLPHLEFVHISIYLELSSFCPVQSYFLLITQLFLNFWHSYFYILFSHFFINLNRIATENLYSVEQRFTNRSA
jgi:hypothetical protein